MKRLGIVGLEHFHVTGWVESLELFPDQIEIVAIYDPDPKRGELLAPTHHDPHLSPSLKPRFRELPFMTDLDELVDNHRLDLLLAPLSRDVNLTL